VPEPQQDETQASKLNSIACQVHQVMILQFDIIKNRLIYVEIVSSLRVERAKTIMYVSTRMQIERILYKCMEDSRTVVLPRLSRTPSTTVGARVTMKVVTLYL
jgi:hypothetical protein